MATDSDENAAALKKWCQKINAIMQADGNRRGIIFIVGMSDATGTSIDTRNVEDTFRKLDFAVFTEKNLHTDDMKALAKAIGTKEFPKKHFYKYIAFYYTGHGGIDDNGKTFFKPLQADTTSEEYVYLENDIISPITLGLKKKCLLFFLDCCRMSCALPSDGGSHPKIQIHSIQHPDYLVAYAASFGNMSHGNKTTGGVWTSILCKYLMKEGKRLSAVLDDTMSEVRKTTEQSCSYDNQLKEPKNIILKCINDSVKVAVVKLQKKFDDLMEKLISVLPEADINQLKNQINSFVREHLMPQPVDDVIEKHMKEIEACKTSIAIVCYLQRHNFISYINYGLLKIFKGITHDTELNDRIDEYKESYCQFFQFSLRDVVAAFEQCPADLQPDNNDPDDLPHFSLHFKSEWDRKSMYNWAEFLKERFEWSPDLHIIGISVHSFMIKYAVWPHQAKSVATDLKNPDIRKELANFGITVSFSSDLETYIKPLKVDVPESCIHKDQKKMESDSDSDTTEEAKVQKKIYHGMAMELDESKKTILALKGQMLRLQQGTVANQPQRPIASSPESIVKKPANVEEKSYHGTAMELDEIANQPQRPIASSPESIVKKPANVHTENDQIQILKWIKEHPRTVICTIALAGGFAVAYFIYKRKNNMPCNTQKKNFVNWYWKLLSWTSYDLI